MMRGICISLLSQGQDAPWTERPEIFYPVVITALPFLIMLFISLPKLTAWWRGRGRQGVMEPIQVEELLFTENTLILDIRDPGESKTKLGHIRGALSMPFTEVERRLGELHFQEPRPIVVVDHTDKRAYVIADYLKSKGIDWVYVLKGGMRAWKRDRLPLYH